MRPRFRLVALTLWPAIASASPMFTGLGDLPGGAFSSGNAAVSASGQVAVGESRTHTDNEAFVWAAGSMTRLGDPLDGETDSFPRAVSADGSVIVGHSGNHAFIWQASTGIVAMDASTSGLSPVDANDVSDDGLVVVGEALSGNLQAFRWTAAEGVTSVGTLEAGGFSDAYGISGDGSVVVGASSSPRYPGQTEAFVWTAAAGLAGIGGDPSGEFFSTAWDASFDGSILGGVGFVAGGPAAQAFLWTQEAGGHSLGFSGQVFALSANGSVAVGYTTIGGESAFVWDAVNGMRLVQDVVATELGLDLTGWTLKQATGISADGRTIVGHGINPGGSSEAWIAFIPEPSTTLLLACGLLLSFSRYGGAL